MTLDMQKRIEIDNTPTCWEKLAEEFDPYAQMTVYTEIEGPLSDEQLFCLRCCFIILDRMKQGSLRPSSFTLQIRANSIEDVFRLRHYLSLITLLRNIRLELIYGDKIYRGQENIQYNYYHILPLFCVGVKRERWMTGYGTMVDPGEFQRVQTALIQSFQEKPRLESRWSDQTANLLDWICFHNVWYLQRNISGPERGSMSKSVKQTLRKELLQHLREELPYQGLLARLLWSIFLRSFSVSKDLFCRDQNGSWHIDEELFQCTKLDALTYAEGILQLMENACLHTEMRRSYISIRISDVNVTVQGVKRRVTAAQKREEIYQRHKQFWAKEDAPSERDVKRKGDAQYFLERDVKFSLEVSVLNDAIRGSDPANREFWGITKTFVHNRQDSDRSLHEVPVPSLETVFAYQCSKMSEIAQHYGLRLLEKTVQMNGGFFTVVSPNISGGRREGYGSFYRNGVKKIYHADLAWGTCTEFNILLPMYPHWHSVPEQRERSSPPEDLFQREPLEGRTYSQKILRLQAGSILNGREIFFQEASELLPPQSRVSHEYSAVSKSLQEWSNAKEQLARRVFRELNQKMQEEGESLWMLDCMHVWDTISIELLAKAIFYLLAWSHSQRKRRLLALLLPNQIFVSEFLRIYSIFYDKQLSNSSWTGDSQIALCGYQEEQGGQFPRVHLLLAGKSSGSARATARMFAYYNTGRSLELIPQIHYLTRSEREDAVPQFPFDLFLTASSESGTGKKCWFLEQMDHTLEQDLWQRSHGCQLKNIRVRLHSNIYLSSFYEAELLFQNVGIIYRFAYLIVRDLLQQLLKKTGNPENALVVVGYEFYSSVLTEQVAELLSGWRETYHLIYANSPEDPIHGSACLKNMEQHERERILEKADYVVILPIGTTLSTLYQIMGEIKACWQGSHFPYDAYVLILVGEEQGTMSDRYWRMEGAERVALRPQRSGDSTVFCRYLLSPKAQWSEMYCAQTGKREQENVLVYVDKTSTRPKEIFVLEGAHFKGVSHFLKDPSENDRRLALLKGLIYYGHIVEGGNHFQFYIDMERYFFRAQQADSFGKRQTVSEWLRSLRKDIDPNAYNIIVSPLHREDSPFAKAVIDQVFEHSLRFVHMNPADTYREDARAKFSYIADEYRKIRQFDRHKPVNVYFVNTAITSGATITRARNLITMLMEESGMPYERGSVFKGCFVLINRSAYDTLNSYIEEPDRHFWAYLHLAVPSFNSRRDRCPTCELTEQYRALEYSSAMNMLGHEFHRLRLKHQKRTLHEYRTWLAEAVMDSGGYAGWLRQWLYSYVRTARRKEDGYHVGIFTVNEEEYEDLLILYRLTMWGVNQFLAEKGVGSDLDGELDAQFLETIHSFTLNELVRLVNRYPNKAAEIVGGRSRCLEKQFWRQVLINRVCAQKNYIRLVSMHRAYLKMDSMTAQLADTIPERGRQTGNVLIEFMKDQLEQKETTALKAEWLISYLKVLSRPHLAQYHHIRQGILSIMLHMTAYAIGRAEKLPETLNFAEPFLRGNVSGAGEMIQSQVLQTLLKRSAGLQSTYFLYRDTMENVLETFDRLRKSFLTQAQDGAWEYQCCNPFPTKSQVEQNMIKLVKWTSSYGDDENGCYLIEESFLDQGEDAKHEP